MNRLRDILLIVALLLGLPLMSGTAQAEKTLLLIESYDAGFDWDAAYRQALVSSLGEGYRLISFEMDTKHLPKEQHALMADRAWAKYQATQPDLVLLADDAALSLLAERFAATRTPVVYLGINNNPRAYIPAHATNFTGVLERPLIKRGIASLNKILPSAKKVLLLFDDDVTSRVIHQELFAGRSGQVIAGIQVNIVLVRTFSEWQQILRTANKTHDACFIGLYQALADENGRNVAEDKVMHWSATNATIPLFAFWDFAIGPDKTAGGLVLSGEDMGTQAAVLAKRILESATLPGTITPIFNHAGKYLFSRQQLQKWRIQIPPEIAGMATFIE